MRHKPAKTCHEGCRPPAAKDDEPPDEVEQQDGRMLSIVGNGRCYWLLSVGAAVGDSNALSQLCLKRQFAFEVIFKAASAVIFEVIFAIVFEAIFNVIFEATYKMVPFSPFLSSLPLGVNSDFGLGGSPREGAQLFGTFSSFPF